MKKFLSMLLAVALVLSMGVVAMAAEPVTTAEALTTAIAAGGTVTLGDNIEQTVTIPEGVTVTLDLNGHTLTNTAGNHTIVNNGNLTVTGTGTVDCVSHGKAAIFNAQGATATLESGDFSRSKENGQSSADNGGNSYYVIQNQGTMTIESGVEVTQEGHYSSLVTNGWQNGAQNTAGTPATLIINGGNFSGGINTIKNDDCGVLTINDGTFVNATQQAVMNWNEATISGGSFESTKSCAVWNGYIDGKEYDKGTLTISGGSFKVPDNTYLVYFGDGKGQGGEVTVTGGEYSNKYVSNVPEATETIVKAADVYVVGTDAENAIKTATSGTTIEVVKVPANTAFENVANGVTIVNQSTSEITVNGTAVTAETGSITVAAPTTEPTTPTEPAKPVYRDTVTIEIGGDKTEEETKTETETEANPNTGAPSFIGVAVAASVLALGGIVLSKRK